MAGDPLLGQSWRPGPQRVALTATMRAAWFGVMNDIVIREPVVMRDMDGPPRRLSAAGTRLRYVWRGRANQPVFLLQNSRDSVWEHIDVVCETPCEAVFVVERTRSGAGVIPSSMHQFRDVRVFGNKLAARGVWHRSTIDENNEHGRFDSVSVYGCTVPWVFQGQQSKEHLLTHCRAETCRVAVQSESGFQWIGGTAAVCEVGVELTRVGDPVTLQGVGFEACGRVLVTSGPTTAAQPVALINCRYEADQLHRDGHAIVLRHAGPLVIVGGRYGGGKQHLPRIALLGVGQQTLTLSGVTFGSFGAYRLPPVVTQHVENAMVTGSGLVYQRAEGDAANTQGMRATPTVQRIGP